MIRLIIYLNPKNCKGNNEFAGKEILYQCQNMIWKLEFLVSVVCRITIPASADVSDVT